MKKLLLIPAAALELAVLVFGWVLAFIAPSAAIRWVHWWWDRLPYPEWYARKEKS